MHSSSTSRLGLQVAVARRRTRDQRETFEEFMIRKRKELALIEAVQDWT
jgi:hypothetical protein